jgi:ATP/maltotriose-dependent transcriptional regulator MalT
VLIDSVPRLRPNLVLRERLLSVLERWTGYEVILLQAPAGFGKTTLAATWVHRLETLAPDRRPHIAWAALEDTDGSATSLLQRLHEALAPLHPRITSSFTLLQAAQIDAAQFLEEVRHCCDESAVPTLIILDDIHTAHGADAAHLLQMLADQAAAGMRLILLSRVRTTINLVPHTLAGRVLVIDADELALDHDEFEKLAAATRLTELPPDRRHLIERKMRGWAAGLQLLIHSLPSTGPLTENAVLAAQSREEIVEYLDREMLSRLPEPLLAFLTHIAFLPILNPHLCAAVTELPVATCAQLLSQAVDATGFLDRFTYHRANDASNGAVGFRMHSLLREHLVARLHNLQSAAELRRIRDNAVHWLAAHDQIDSALQLLLPASLASDEGSIDDADLSFAADLLESACSQALRRANVNFVTRWLERLPSSLLESRPRLALDAAWADLHLLHPRLRTRIEMATRAVTFAQRHSRPTTDFSAELAVLCALCGAFEGNFEEAERSIQIAGAVHAAQLPVPRGYLHLLRAYHFTSHPIPIEERRTEITASIRAFRDGDFLRGQVEAFTIAGVVETYQPNGPTVIDTYTKGLEFIRMVGWEQSTYGINAHLYLGDALYHSHRIDDARTHFLQAMELAALAETEASTSYFARVYLQLCDAAQNSSLAVEIDPAEDFAQWQAIRALSAPRLWHAVSYMRMIRNLRLGQIHQCISDLTRVNLLPEQLNDQTVPVSVLTSVAGSFFAGEHIAPAARLLERFCTRMKKIGYESMVLRGRVLQALHQHLLGNENAAVETLQNTLAAIDDAGLQRAVLDITPLRGVLRRCDTSLARKFLALDDSHTPTPVLRPFSLSNQELAILRRLAVFHDTRAIAADMAISYSTVRTHLRNCYSKMNVHSRVAALEAARTAGLLD